MSYTPSKDAADDRLLSAARWGHPAENEGHEDPKAEHDDRRSPGPQIPLLVSLKHTVWVVGPTFRRTKLRKVGERGDAKTQKVQ